MTDTAPRPTLPTVRYGEASLADLLPSVLASLGVGGEPNPLTLADTARAVVLLVDGMGWELLKRHADAAPFLTGLTGRPLTAGFPSTTVTSLTSLGTGLPPGEHGLTGYSSYVEEVGDAVNWLAWRPVGSGGDLRDRLPPEQVQPQPTAFERAADAGVTVTTATSAQFADSGLTRAALRGGRFAGSYAWGDSLALALDGVQRGNRSLVYCYLSELDLIGHVRGSETDAWLSQLQLVDGFARLLAEQLPPDAVLHVTADHGMVVVPEEGRVDVDASGILQDGVVALAGEPRMRHVHTRPGAARDVLAAWTAELGDRMWIGTRDDAVAAGLFGPEVTTTARSRIGDVVAIATTPDVAVVRRSAESMLSSLPGQHGALTDDELLVPLLSTGAG
ncbi:MAG TPA: alkaline phosphatase family protein [Mycobacteriales bacterium]|nr:alkaline phosphatase family protein [Mycobacteriales bacterium]